MFDIMILGLEQIYSQVEITSILRVLSPSAIYCKLL